ncbi:hypothetical protein IG631_16100 [Alternaria alternata]|nr:hypothetical protein IG631_16100 [Alternaria alternata]
MPASSSAIDAPEMFHGPAHLVYATAAFASSIWHLTIFCQCLLKQIGTGAPPDASITITAARYQRGIHFRLPCKACCRNWEHPGCVDQWTHVPTQSRHAQLPSATAFVFAVPDLKNGPFECSPSTSIRAVVATLSPLQSQGLYITCTTWRS